MSVTSKRDLMAAVHKLVHASQPEMADFEAVTAALAQVFTDETGVECQVAMRVKVSSLNEVLKIHGI